MIDIKNKIMHLLHDAKTELENAGIIKIWYESDVGWAETTYITIETDHDQVEQITAKGKSYEIIRISKKDGEIVHKILESLDEELFECRASFQFQSIFSKGQQSEIVYPVSLIIENKKKILEDFQQKMQAEIDDLVSEFGFSKG